MTGAGRRLGWTFLDQGLSSSSNFLLTFGVLHVTTGEPLGLFGLFFLCFSLTLTASRAAAADLVIARASELNLPDALAFAQNRRPLAAFVGVLGGLVTAAVLLFAGADATTSVVLAAAAFPVLAVQDFERFVAVSSGSPQRACVSDALWLGVVAACPLSRWALGEPTTLSWLLGAWSVGGGLAALLGLRLNDAAWVAPTLVRTSARVDAALRRSYAVDALAYIAGGPALLLVIGLVVGANEFAGVTAAQTLLSPANVLVSAAVFYVAPEARRRDTHTRRQRRFLLASSALLACGILTYTVALLVGPVDLFEAVFGRDPAEEFSFVVALAAYLTCSALMSGAAVGLRVGPRPRTAAALRTAYSAVALVAATLAANKYGALPALQCWAAVTLAFVPAWWAAYYRSRSDQYSAASSQAAVTPDRHSPASEDVNAGGRWVPPRAH